MFRNGTWSFLQPVFLFVVGVTSVPFFNSETRTRFVTVSRPVTLTIGTPIPARGTNPVNASRMKHSSKEQVKQASKAKFRKGVGVGGIAMLHNKKYMTMEARQDINRQVKQQFGFLVVKNTITQGFMFSRIRIKRISARLCPGINWKLPRPNFRFFAFSGFSPLLK